MFWTASSRKFWVFAVAWTVAENVVMGMDQSRTSTAVRWR